MSILVHYGRVSDDSPNRIRELRKGRGWTLEHLADHVGTTPKQLSRLERGERNLTQDWMLRISEALGTSPAALFDRTGAARSAPLVGYVGAGEMYYPSPESGPWVGFDEVDAPPAGDDMVAIKVRGDALEPVYRPGDVLFFRRPDGFDAEACIGRDCVIQLQNGPAYLKRLERDQSGAYRLTSHRSEPIENADVEWAEPVLWIRKV